MNTTKGLTIYNFFIPLFLILTYSCSSNPALDYHNREQFIFNDENSDFILDGKKTVKIEAQKADLYIAFSDYWQLNQIFHLKVKNNSNKSITISPKDFHVSGRSVYDTEKNIKHYREAQGINPTSKLIEINKRLNYLRNDAFSGFEYFSEFVDNFTKDTEDKAKREKEREEKKAKIEKEINELEDKKRIYSQIFKGQTLLSGETFQGKIMFPLLRGVIEQKMKILFSGKEYVLNMKQNITIEND